MSTFATHTADVIVVGAGPAGLTLAGDLARVGRSVIVLERRAAINPSSRAFATMARTLELLDARGLAEGLLANAHRAAAVSLFAGARLDLSHLPSRYPFTMVTPQTKVDRALAFYATLHGADIRRDVEVVALNQNAEGVTVTVRSGEQENSEPLQTFWAKYVVGADGAHSTVRRLVGADFPGATVLSSLVLADVKLADGPIDGGLTVRSTRDAFGFLAPFNRYDRWYRAMTWDRHRQLPDTEPPTAAEIADVLSRAMGRDFEILDVGSMSRFHCDERQVTQYRHGRIFLAGDAAHVHSPMGGQGMNTGIQDAANLAWKLDAALGGAPDRVLDTYHTERHPIGRRVLRQSGFIARAITLRPRLARGVRNLLAPRLLRIASVRDAVAGSFAGTSLNYRPPGATSPLIGTPGTGIPLREGRLTVLQRTPGFVLVRERGTSPAPTGDVLHAERTDDGPAVLVRPDGYITWVGNSADVDGWRKELARWTTSPTVHRLTLTSLSRTV